MAGRTRENVALIRRSIWDLRVSGKTAAEIAAHVRLSESIVHRHLKASVAMIDATAWLAEETSLDLSRLNKLISIYMPYATGEHRGQEDGSPPSLEHAKFVVDLLKRRAAMLGLDAPKRIDIRQEIIEYALREGLDPDDVLDVTQNLFPVPA